MATFDFPIYPLDGQLYPEVYSSDAYQYVWSTVKGAWLVWRSSELYTNNPFGFFLPPLTSVLEVSVTWHDPAQLLRAEGCVHFRVNTGSYTQEVTPIESGDTITYRWIPDEGCAYAPHDTILTGALIGQIGATVYRQDFALILDRVPDPFDFVDITQEEEGLVAGLRESNTITLTGLNSSTFAWVESGTASLAQISLGDDSWSDLPSNRSEGVEIPYSETPLVIKIRHFSELNKDNITVVAFGDRVRPFQESDTWITLLSVPSNFEVIPSSTTVVEGSNITWSVTATNFDSNTLYYTIAGTVVDLDFVDGISSGSINTNINGIGSLTKSLATDGLIEGDETLTLELRTGSTSGSVVATATTVVVKDSDFSVPTATVTPNKTTVSEGDSVTWTIQTTNFADGPATYIISGTGITSADFTGDDALTGQVNIVNGVGTLTKTLSSDLITEGVEYLHCEVTLESGTNPPVYNSPAVAITDTSLTPPFQPTYSIDSYTGFEDPRYEVDEGTDITWTITTTHVSDGTRLYYTNSGTTDSADFTDGSDSGSVVIIGGTASFTKELTDDHLEPGGLEGLETIIFNVRTSSTSGNIVATSPTITVVE